MAHQSLYRKYRPSTFDDVVGQQHIERTLRNAVAEGSVAHAYLFTGPRGTGKTSTARILAKALLCERGPSSEPDGTCDQCVDVAEGRHPDVFELDAASRTGVENVREEIIGRVQFAPTRGRYKIYIIDEVHMLSAAAFNALLKTLEEPPPHVVFILCTTHPHKVPETIHSRCQRFDFHRIGVDDIADRLRFIAESEGYRIDRGAFTLIARHAEGGMRDAITTLEQLAAFTGGEVTVDDVEGLIGQVDSEQLFEVSGLVARRDIAALFRWVAATAETGTDLAELVRELTGHVRDLFVIAAVGDGTGVVDRTTEELSKLQVQAVEFGGPDRLSRMLDLLGELAAEMRWSSDPRLSIEVALTRMARPHGEMTLEAVAERVEALERGLSTDTAAPVRSAEPASAPPQEIDSAPHRGTAPPAVTSEEAQEPVVTPVKRAGALDRGSAKRNWQAVLIELKKEKPARANLFASVEVDIEADGSTLVLEFPEDQGFSLQMAEEPEMRDLLRTAVSRVFGFAPPFRYQLGRGAVRPPIEMETAEPTSRVDISPESSDVSAGDEPMPEYYETATGFTEPAERRDDSPQYGLDAVLSQLGAHIVSEHMHEPDGEDDQ